MYRRWRGTGVATRPCRGLWSFDDPFWIYTEQPVGQHFSSLSAYPWFPGGSQPWALNDVPNRAEARRRRAGTQPAHLDQQGCSSPSTSSRARAIPSAGFGLTVLGDSRGTETRRTNVSHRLSRHAAPRIVLSIANRLRGPGLSPVGQRSRVFDRRNGPRFYDVADAGRRSRGRCLRRRSPAGPGSGAG